MRLLFLTNFYPPLHRGGYEQWCYEVAQALQAQGHEVAVLTSRYRLAELSEPQANVHRVLHLETEISPLANSYRFFWGRRAREQANLDFTHRLCDEARPDAILVWGMWNLSWEIVALLEGMFPGRVAYYIGDYWLRLPPQYVHYWHTPGGSWRTKLPKLLLGTLARRQLAREKRPRLLLEHGLFPTQFMRDELEKSGVHFKQSTIVPGAIDTSQYSCQVRKEAKLLQLLYVGRLLEDKGVHTAIEAVSLLVRQGVTNIHLTLVGEGEADYTARLRQLAEPIQRYVTFRGTVSPAGMPAVYENADVLLFTSIWPEPFGRVIVEAMASGTIVIGTGTGGAGEILQDGENGLVFPAGDVHTLAQKISHLKQKPQLRLQLAKNAKQTAKQFDTTQMVNAIETYLHNLLAT